MLRYSEAVKADVTMQISPPQSQSVARISKELGIHVMTPTAGVKPRSLKER